MPFLAALIALAAPQSLGEVPFKIGEDAIIVDAKVNNRKLSLMFDTGFSGSVICDDNINLGQASGTLNLRDFVGEFQARTVNMKTLQLGSMSIDPAGLEIVQQPVAHMSFSYNAHTDGIMGFEVISKNVTEINFQNQKFIFYPKTLDISKRVPDNKKTFLLKMLPIGHNSVELEVMTPSGKRMVLALDTGNAFYATTHRDVLERVGLWDSAKTPRFMKSAFVASGEVASWYKKMSDLTIFGVPVKESYWSIIDLPSSSAEGDGTVGYGFLHNFNVTIDYDRRRVWLERWTDKVENEPDGEVGLTAGFDPRAGRVRIFKVAPESPAEKAGIHTGDSLLAVDGTDLSNQTFRVIDNLLKGKKGTKAALVISQNGVLKRLEVDREYLVND